MDTVGKIRLRYDRFSQTYGVVVVHTVESSVSVLRVSHFRFCVFARQTAAVGGFAECKEKTAHKTQERWKNIVKKESRCVLEIKVGDEKKLVEIWLTNAEKKDPDMRESLKGIYDTFKKKKYLVAVFESGEKDLYRGTLDLLAYNKRRCAELEVRKAKKSHAEVTEIQTRVIP